MNLKYREVEQVTERLTEIYPCNKCNVEFCSRQCYSMTRWAEKAKEKLAEYETAEEEGRLVMLPCKVGDFVYKIIYQRDNFDDRSYRIVTEVRFRLDMIDDIGKTIFLTREEAEKALKESEIGNETD